jgi:hypothetical protein
MSLDAKAGQINPAKMAKAHERSILVVMTFTQSV